MNSYSTVCTTYFLLTTQQQLWPTSHHTSWWVGGVVEVNAQFDPFHGILGYIVPPSNSFDAEVRLYIDEDTPQLLRVNPATHLSEFERVVVKGMGRKYFPSATYLTMTL